MVFYVFLGLVLLTVGFCVVRSNVFKQWMHGHGGDPGRWGSTWDHVAEQGMGTSWNDDGGNGQRDTHIEPKHTRRR